MVDYDDDDDDDDISSAASTFSIFLPRLPRPQISTYSHSGIGQLHKNSGTNVHLTWMDLQRTGNGLTTFIADHPQTFGHYFYRKDLTCN